MCRYNPSVVIMGDHDRGETIASRQSQTILCQGCIDQTIRLLLFFPADEWSRPKAVGTQQAVKVIELVACWPHLCCCLSPFNEHSLYEYATTHHPP